MTTNVMTHIPVETNPIMVRMNELSKNSFVPMTDDTRSLIMRRLVFVDTQLVIGDFVKIMKTLDEEDSSFDSSRNLMKLVNRKWGEFLYEDSSDPDPRSGLKKFLEKIISCPVLCDPVTLSELPDSTLFEYKKLAEKLNQNLKLL